MRLLVCMFGSLKRIRITSLVVSSVTGVGVKFLGVPPVAFVFVLYGGLAVVLATQNWIERQQDRTESKLR